MKMPLTKEKLLKMVDIWQVNVDDTEEWYQEGINLYKQLCRIDPFYIANYNKNLVNLLLEQARNEKMLQGNIRTAERLLKEVIDIEPEHSEIYYRLAFINEHSKKWEAILFYANEAINQGITLDEEIKLSALMGYAYIQIGLKRHGKELFEHATKLDTDKEWSMFIENYKDLANQRIPLNRNQREERDKSIEVALQQARENLCCILNVYSNNNCLITSTNEISLEPKEAELLAFLVENNGKSVTKEKILNHIWPELANPKSTAVKRTMSTLRTKCAKAFEVNCNQNLIPYEQNGYSLKFPVKVEILKGVDFRRLSCR